MSAEEAKRELRGHTVSTVQEKGWSRKRNSELLRLAESQFDVLITADQNLEHQQNLRQFALAVIVLVAPDNRFPTLQPLMPKVREVLQTIQPREIAYIEA